MEDSTSAEVLNDEQDEAKAIATAASDDLVHAIVFQRSLALERLLQLDRRTITARGARAKARATRATRATPAVFYEPSQQAWEESDSFDWGDDQSAACAASDDLVYAALQQRRDEMTETVTPRGRRAKARIS